MVADTLHNRVVELDAANHQLWEYNKAIAAPHWAERLPGGNVLITVWGDHKVLEVSDNGTVVWGVGDGTPEVLKHPNMAQRLSNGNTLVCDSGNNRVLEVNPQNQLVWILGNGQNGDVGPLSNPSSAKRLATGNTLISDTNNNRVLEVDPEGHLVWKQVVDQPQFADRY
jgi:hypothetical protein